MGVTVAVTQAAANTSTGNQDFTTTDLGGLTPKAAWFYITPVTSNGTAVNGAVMGMGAATGTSNEWAAGYAAQNGQGTSNTIRRGITDGCILLLNTSAVGVDGEAEFVSFITNGVRVNWVNAPGTASLVTVILWAGTDLSAEASIFTASDVSGTSTDITTPGDESDVVLLASTGFDFDDIDRDTIWFSHGVAVNDGSATQRSWNYTDIDNQASTAVVNIFSTNYATGQHSTGSWVWAGEISFIANGFRCTTREGNSGGSDDVGYLALNFNSAVSFAAGTVDAPTSTGDDSQTGPGFTPQLVLQGLTQLTAVDTESTAGAAGSLGISVFDSNNEYSVSTQDEDAAGTTNSQSMVDNQAVNFPQDDGTTGYAATFSSLDGSGWTLNFSNVLGTATKWWYLAISEEGVVPPSPAGALVNFSKKSVLGLPDYEVWLTTDAGVRIAQLTTFTNLTANRVTNGIGYFSMTMPLSFDPDLIVPDRLVQVWRQPAGGRLGLWRVYMVRRWQFSTRGSDQIIEMSGPDINDLLRRRIVAAYSGTPQASKSDFADDIMKEVVTESLADGVEPTPSAGTRVWSNLSVASDLGDGPQITKSFPFSRILTPASQGALPVLAKAAKEAGTEVFFDIVPDTVSGSSIDFIFRTYTNQPGADVSDRITFDQQAGNMRDPMLEYDYTNEENYIYAGGGGQGAARNIQQVSDSDRYGASIWARCEGFADARNQTTDNGVREAGRDALNDGRPRIRFSATPVDTAGTRFGIDWNYGDKVAAKYQNREFDTIIKAVTISVDSSGAETVSARLDFESVI